MVVIKYANCPHCGRGINLKLEATPTILPKTTISIKIIDVEKSKVNLP